MTLKKFDDTNIANPVNNARNLKDILQNNDLCQKHHRNKDAQTIYNNTKCTHSIALTQLQERHQRSIDAQEIPTQLEDGHQRYEGAKKL